MIKAFGYAFTPTQLGNAGLTPQTIQHDQDLPLQTTAICGFHGGYSSRSTQRQSGMQVSISLHSLMVTISRILVPQAAKSVSQALMSDSWV